MPEWLKERLAAGLVLWALIGIGWCIWRIGGWIFRLFAGLF